MKKLYWISPNKEPDTLASRMLAEPHVLIGGTTGSGKSTMIEALLYSICTSAPCERSFAIVDLKRISLTRWKEFPHCQRYANDKETALKLIKDFSATMDDRLKEMEKRSLSVWDKGEIYLIIDEAADLLDNCPESIEYIAHICRLARVTKMHVIYATQAPDRKTIPASLQHNINALLGLRCRSAIESRQVIGSKGCETLPRYGKGLYICPSLMQPEEVQCNMISNDDIAWLCNWWATKGTEYAEE